MDFFIFILTAPYRYWDFLLGSLVFFLFVMKTKKVIKKVVLDPIVDQITDAVYKPKKSSKNDFRDARSNNQEVEQELEQELEQQMGQEFPAQGQQNIKEVVGLNPDRVKGKFTGKMAQEFVQNMAGLNQEMVKQGNINKAKIVAEQNGTKHHANGTGRHR